MKPLDKLKQEYNVYKQAKYFKKQILEDYNILRAFCIECNILTFNEVELMEFEVNQSLS